MASFFPAKIPSFVCKLYPKRIWKVKPGELPATKSVYFTFDDGPIPEVTPWVLDVLKKYNAKASFFCIGDNLRKYPDIVKRILAEGHTLGNHTQHHLNGWKTKRAIYLSDVEEAQSYIDLHQLPYKYFRPPYGKLTSRAANHLLGNGYKIVMWDVLSKDYDSSVSKHVCLSNVTQNIEPGSIVVFHDSLKAEKNLRFVLPKAIETTLEKGYRLENL